MSQAPQGKRPPAQAVRTSTQTPKKGADQFRTQTVNRVIKEMKQVLARGSRAAGLPAIRTAELRAEMRKAAQSGKPGDVSDFERVFLEFFMGERSFGAMLKAGQNKFRKKQLKEWRDFFESLYPCSEEKTVSGEEIRELIFRGISTDDPRVKDPSIKSKAAVLVGDLMIKRKRRDRCEKLIRLPIPNETVKQKLEILEPGERIAMELLSECFGEGDLNFLRLNYRPVRPGLKLTQGDPKALALAAQAKAAARARDAMRSPRMDVSSRSASLAKDQIKGVQPEKKKKATRSERLYNQKARLDKLLG